MAPERRRRSGNPAGRLGRILVNGINEQKRRGEEVQGGLPLSDLGRTAMRGLQAEAREENSMLPTEPDTQQPDKEN